MLRKEFEIIGIRPPPLHIVEMTKIKNLTQGSILKRNLSSATATSSLFLEKPSTSKGSVDIAEESQKNLNSTEMIDKNSVFLNLPALRNKIRIMATECGLEEPDEEVAKLISAACKEKLKYIIEKLGTIAEHRIAANDVRKSS